MFEFLIQEMMNKTIKYFSTFLMAAVLLFTSCEKWIDPDINISPNSPSDVPLYLILPAIQDRTAYTYGGRDVVGCSNMWAQIYSGKSRQALDQDNYRQTDSDVNNMWSSLYSGSMMDCVVLIQKATDQNAPQYKGAAQVMLAYNLQMATDLYGDVPYSEALKGSENYTPKFDAQQDVYAAIDALLAEAITNLGSTTGAIPLGSNGDMIYSGSAAKWIKAANTLRARAALQLSGRNGFPATIKTYATAGIMANADNFNFKYSATDPAGYNPMYQFDDQRNDIRMGKKFIDLLVAANDPRLSLMAHPLTGTSTYKGYAPGASDDSNVSAIGPFLGGATGGLGKGTAVRLASAVENLFILAEFELKQTTPSVANAKTQLKAAVAASLSETGATNFTAWKTAYDASVDAIADPNLLYNEIMVQKWIALAGTLCPFNDWRRVGNGYLNLTKAANGILGNAFPQVYPYPTGEKTNNAANVPARADISARVWWDIADNTPAK